MLKKFCILISSLLIVLCGCGNEKTGFGLNAEDFSKKYNEFIEDAMNIYGENSIRPFKIKDVNEKVTDNNNGYFKLEGNDVKIAFNVDKNENIICVLGSLPTVKYDIKLSTDFFVMSEAIASVVTQKHRKIVNGLINNQYDGKNIITEQDGIIFILGSRNGRNLFGVMTKEFYDENKESIQETMKVKL